MELVAALVVLIIAFVIYSNKKTGTTEYIISDKGIPKSFDGFRIVNVSDFHNRFFGKNSSYLLSEIKKASPDIIVITGDIIDRRNLNIKRAVNFASRAVKIAPVYYVTGNHEAVMVGFDSFIDALKGCGVEYLDNRLVHIHRDTCSICLMGISDPALGVKPEDYDFVGRCVAELKELGASESGFRVLLAHRPELFEVYAAEADVVLCGHAHGGQFRLPFIGGLFAPGQGLLPKYTSGMHTISGARMIISRGIGNSSFPIRINNNPELVAVELKSRK